MKFFVLHTLIGTLFMWLSVSATFAKSPSACPAIHLTGQTRDANGKAAEQSIAIEPAKTAVVVIDMWDRHWCKSFTSKVDKLVSPMNEALEACRKLGIQVVFAPSDVADFYRDAPQRKAMQAIPSHPEPKKGAFNPPPPPGPTNYCECGPERPCPSALVWTRQHSGLKIAPQDLIGDCNNGRELTNLCAERGIDTLLYMGVASNMCVLNRSMGILNMKSRGLRAIVVADMVKPITSNGLDAQGKPDPSFTPDAGTARVQRYIEQSVCPTIESRQLSAALSQLSGQSLFTPEEVQAYVPKGPSQCYRYFCSDHNLVSSAPPADYFTKADPVKYAEFMAELHADAALLLAVPSEGYCTYRSEIGPVYPACQKNDFFGQTIRELHRRDISAFAYVTLGVNLRYLREHPEYVDGSQWGFVNPCFCSPYMDLIIAYSQEILRKYPVDGLRWDILSQGCQCRCDGCKKLYRQMFGEEMPKDWKTVDWRRKELFREAKLVQAVRRLHDACKAVKPSVEIWHNQLNVDHDVPLSALKYVNMAYIEFADPWGLLFHDAATPTGGFIVGKLESLGPRTMRLCLALGGHGYTYIKARHDTALPPKSEEEADRWRRQRGWTGGAARENARSQPETLAKLGTFYETLSKAQNYYEGGRPVYCGIGVVFCDATRYKYPNFSRGRYIDLLKKLGNAYLKQSAALEYLSSETLPERDLSRYRVLVLPETSGLKPKELDALQAYVREGGKLLVAGNALRHDERGEPLKEFALADIKDQIHFLASDSLDLLQKTIDSLAGPRPVTVSSADKQVVLTRQEKRNRWVLHILDDGDCTVEIDRKFAAPTKIAEMYPPEGWTAAMEKTEAGMRVTVRGDAGNRLLVLQ